RGLRTDADRLDARDRFIEHTLGVVVVTEAHGGTGELHRVEHVAAFTLHVERAIQGTKLFGGIFVPEPRLDRIDLLPGETRLGGGTAGEENGSHHHSPRQNTLKEAIHSWFR